MTVAHVAHCGLMSGDSASTSGAWTVTSWNLLGSADPDIDAIARHLASFAPDIAALQEVRRSQARQLAAALGWQSAWRRKHYPYSPVVWWRAEGLAILSPHPIVAVRRHTLSTGHPIWNYRHRIMLSATVRRPLLDGTHGGTLDVHDVHLSSDSTDERVLQAQRAATVARSRRDVCRDELVVCGDLNASDEPSVIASFASLGLVDPGGPHTVKADVPARRLDYVLVPATARSVSVSTPEGGTDWRQLSDHLPVTTRFELPTAHCAD